MIAISTALAVSKIASMTMLGGTAGIVGYQMFRPQTLQRTVQEVFAACGLCDIGKDRQPKPWRIVKVRRTDFGTRLVMKFPYGKTLEHVIGKVDEINTALGAEVSLARDGKLLVIDINEYPLPTYVTFSRRMEQVTRGKWASVIGVNSKGLVIHDWNANPMILLAGMTRWGKTEAIKSLVVPVHLNHSRDDVEFIGVDMKPMSLEFRRFGALWSKPLISTPEGFVDAIQDCLDDMTRRAEILAEAGCANVGQYERLTGKTFKRRFLVVDEYGKSFGSSVEKDITQLMMQLTAQSAALGIHVILCTQRPDAEVVSGKIRANMGTILCTQVANTTQSVVVLGHKGAEQLPGIRGRAIYQSFGMETTLQVPHVSDRQMDRIFKSGGLEPVEVSKQVVESGYPQPARHADVVRLYD